MNQQNNIACLKLLNHHTRRLISIFQQQIQPQQDAVFRQIESSQQFLHQMIKHIHDSHLYGSIAELGAGVPIADRLFKVAGASKTIYESLSPYSREAQAQRFGRATSFRTVSREYVSFILDQLWSSPHESKEGEEKSAQSGATGINFALATSFQISQDTQRTHGWVGLRYLHQKTERNLFFHLSLPRAQATAMKRDEICDEVGLFGIHLLCSIMDHNNSNDNSTRLCCAGSPMGLLNTAGFIVEIVADDDQEKNSILQRTILANQHFFPNVDTSRMVFAGRTVEGQNGERLLQLIRLDEKCRGKRFLCVYQNLAVLKASRGVSLETNDDEVPACLFDLSTSNPDVIHEAEQLGCFALFANIADGGFSQQEFSQWVKEEFNGLDVYYPHWGRQV